MPEPEKKNPYEVILERLDVQEERIKVLEAENKDVIEFNKALLSRNGTKRVVSEVEDKDVDRAKEKLNKYLEEN